MSAISRYSSLPSRSQTIGINFAKYVLPITVRQYDAKCIRYQKIEQICKYTTQPSKNPGFIGKFVDNLRQEMAKNKEMKENLRKFREEAEKLEHSEALKKARQKYQTVESEASKSSEVLKEHIGSIKHKMHDVLEEAAKTDLAKKAGQIKEEISKVAQGAADTISDSGSKLGKTGAFRTISVTAQKFKEEIDQSSIGGNVYRAPKQLRKRVESIERVQDIAPNNDATGVELHKDSKYVKKTMSLEENYDHM